MEKRILKQGCCVFVLLCFLFICACSAGGGPEAQPPVNAPQGPSAEAAPSGETAEIITEIAAEIPSEKDAEDAETGAVLPEEPKAEKPAAPQAGPAPVQPAAAEEPAKLPQEQAEAVPAQIEVIPEALPEPPEEAAAEEPTETEEETVWLPMEIIDEPRDPSLPYWVTPAVQIPGQDPYPADFYGGYAYLNTILDSLEVSGTPGNYHCKFSVPAVPEGVRVYYYGGFFNPNGGTIANLLESRTAPAEIDQAITCLANISQLGTAGFEFSYCDERSGDHSYFVMWTPEGVGLRYERNTIDAKLFKDELPSLYSKVEKAFTWK